VLTCVVQCVVVRCDQRTSLKQKQDEQSTPDMAATAPLATPMSLDVVLQLVGSHGFTAEELRTTQNAFKKYTLLFDTEDVMTAFARLDDVKLRFEQQLAPHSVRNYLTAMQRAWSVPDVRGRAPPPQQDAVDARLQELVAEATAAAAATQPRSGGSGRPPLQLAATDGVVGKPQQGSAAAAAAPQSTTAAVTAALVGGAGGSPSRQRRSRSSAATTAALAAEAAQHAGEVEALRAEVQRLAQQLEIAKARLEDAHRVIDGLIVKRA
jgi:hypothetical protein